MSALRDALRILTMPCRDATEAISRAMDERLPWSLAAAVRVHKLVCSACRRYERQLHALREILAHGADASGEDSGAPLRLGDEARRRIESALRDANP